MSPMFSTINNQSINPLSSAIYLLMSVKRVPQGMLLERDHRTAGSGFRITIKHDLCAGTAPSALVIPSARNDIPRKREREFCRRRSGASDKEARPGDVLIMRSKRDLPRITSERLTWTSSQLLTAILNAATSRDVGGQAAFVTLMRDFIARPFLIVVLTTRPILSGTLASPFRFSPPSLSSRARQSDF